MFVIDVLELILLMFSVASAKIFLLVEGGTKNVWTGPFFSETAWIVVVGILLPLFLNFFKAGQPLLFDI